MNKKNRGLFVRDNRGTSIVELLVIMAIMAILVGMVTNLFGYLNGKEAKQCAYKLEAAISEIRMETMSKSDGEKESVYLVLENRNDQIYAGRSIRSDVTSDLIGEKVVITVKDASGNEIGVLTDGKAVPIYFNRATGALLEESEKYAAFEVTQGKVTYVVKIEPTTGRISNERK